MLPWGRWPEFCVQSRPGRRKILANRETSFLLRLFFRTHLWYLRYIFQYLTAPLRKEPTFFLMGFPKCGTTFLANLLDTIDDIGHPTWLAPLAKETVHYRRDQPIHFFMPIRGFYPIFSRATHFVDASVSYSLDPGAMSLVSSDYPHARVILVVRDQVSAFESGINYYNFGLWRPDPKSLQAFNQAERYRLFPMHKACRVVEYARYRQCSIVAAHQDPEIIELLGEDAAIAHRFSPLLYDLWMAHIYERFPAQQVLVLNFAELIEHPDSVLERTARFIGVDELPRGMNLNRDQVDSHASRKVFSLNPESKQAIRDRFFKHNEALKSLTGIDLN